MLAILGALAASVITYQNSLDTLAADRVAPLRQMFQISRDLTRIEVTGSDLLRDPRNLALAPERMAVALGEIDAMWRQYEITYLTPEEIVLAARAKQSIVEMRVSLGRFMTLVQPAPGAEAALEYTASLRPLIEESRRHLDALVELQQRVSDEVLAAAKRQKTLSLLVAIGAGLFGILAVAYGFYMVRRFIVSPFIQARRALSNLAIGEVEQIVPKAESEEMDELFGDIRQTREKLVDVVRAQSSARQQANEFAAQLDAVFKYAPFGLFIKDRAGKFIAVNDAEAQLWGLTKDCMVGRLSEEIVPAADIDLVRQSDQHVFETGTPIAVEYPGQPGTSYEWLQTVKFPIRNQTGEVFALAAFDIDQSDSKRRMYEIEASALQLRRSSEMAGIHYWLWHRSAAGHERINYDGREWVVPEGGYDIAAEYESYLEKRVHPDDRGQVAPIYRDFVDGKIQKYQLEYRFCRSDGSYVPLKVWTERVIDATTGDIHVHMISFDIADIKAREEELIVARLHAEVADRAKTDFLANMSHELRTPLNPILGFAEILQYRFAKQGDAEVVNYLSLIHEGGKNLLQTINIILEFAQLDVVDTPLDQFEVGLRELFDASIATVETRGIGSQITFVTHLDNEEHCVVAEERALRRALTNVLTNAAQHAPPGSAVTVQMERLNATEFAISVADEGVGFPADLLPDIGKAFVRGGDALRYQHGGIGLGLTIAGKLMALHGGRIEVANLAMGGAKVSLVFPISRLIEGHPVLATALARPAK